MTQREMNQRIADLRTQGMGCRAAGEQAYREAVAAATTRHYAGMQTGSAPIAWADDHRVGIN